MANVHAGGQIWSPNGSVSPLGCNHVPGTDISFVTTPAHPLGGSRRYVCSDLSVTDADAQIEIMWNLEGLSPGDNGGLAGDGPDATARWGVKHSLFYRFESNAADDAPAAQRMIFGPAYPGGWPPTWGLFLNADRTVTLKRKTDSVTWITLGTSTATLSGSTDVKLIVWRIYRDSSGALLSNVQYVVQLVQNPLTTRDTSTLLNVNDTTPATYTGSNNGLYFGDTISGAGDANAFKQYGGTFYAAMEDADNPSGLIRDARGLPVAGTVQYDEWDAVGSANKYENVDEDPPDENTTYNKTNVDGERQSHQMTDSLLPSGATMHFAEHHIYYAQTVVGSKNGRVGALLYYNGNIYEKGAANRDDTDYVNVRPGPSGTKGRECIIWDMAPGGVSWSSSVLDALEIGYYYGGTGNVECRTTHCTLTIAYEASGETLPAPPPVPPPPPPPEPTPAVQGASVVGLSAGVF